VTDEAFMARALGIAAAQLGRTAPNPSVGCVLVKGGAVLAEAATADGGRPHAEEQALAAAGEQARGGAAFVTLEPCGERSGGGRSCAELLIAAGVSRVVVAVEDPHPHGAGGIALLRAAGVSLRLGVLRAEATDLNAGFFHRVRTGRPLARIDADASRYDAVLALQPGETLDAALARLGKAGLTRVAARPGSAEAAALIAAGLA
jgi:diaminohydroxyphosphoribosylaminopyrimidine deaminase/5-amino-6-(5-phosphoribosylamino)uracil reductase